jgi:hypothetical protein
MDKNIRPVAAGFSGFNVTEVKKEVVKEKPEILDIPEDKLKEIETKIEEKYKDKVSSVSKSFSETRKIVAEKEKAIADLKGELEAVKSGKSDLPHPKIVKSSDFKEEERANKTQAELDLIDKLAEMQEKENQAYLKSKQVEAPRTPTWKKTVADKIKILADGNDTVREELENEAALFNFEGKTETEIEGILNKAMKLVRAPYSSISLGQGAAPSIPQGKVEKDLLKNNKWVDELIKM